MNTFPPLPHSFRLPVGVELTDRIIRLIGRSVRKSGDIWLHNISGSGTWLSAQILKSQESFHFIRRQNHIFSLPESLFTIYIWLRKRHVIHFLLPLLELSSILEINVWRCIYDAHIFSVQVNLECVPSLCLYLSWPQLYLWVNFHYNSIIHQKIELSVPLQRWKTLEIFSNQTLYSHCKKKKKQPPDLQGNSIKSHIHDSAVCHHIPHILLLFLSTTHWERSFTVTVSSLTITFLKSASFRGKGKGDNGQPWHFPREPCQNMMPREAVGAAEMVFSFAPAGRTWQTERGTVSWSSWY